MMINYFVWPLIAALEDARQNYINVMYIYREIYVMIYVLSLPHLFSKVSNLNLFQS